MSQDRVCVNCGEELYEGSQFCSRCGSGVHTTDVIECPECGQNNSHKALYCDQCHNSLSLISQDSVVLEDGKVEQPNLSGGKSENESIPSHILKKSGPENTSTNSSAKTLPYLASSIAIIFLLLALVILIVVMVFDRDKSDSTASSMLPAMEEIGRYGTLLKIPESIQILNSTIDVNPNDAKSYYERGNAYIEVGQTWYRFGAKQYLYQLAIEDYDKAIGLNPEYAEAYYKKGYLYDSQIIFGESRNEENKRHEKALKLYTKAIELNPKFTDAYVARGLIYRTWAIRESRNLELATTDNQLYQKAMQDFDKAINLNPENAESYLKYRRFLSWCFMIAHIKTCA